MSKPTQQWWKDYLKAEDEDFALQVAKELNRTTKPKPKLLPRKHHLIAA